MESLDLNIDNYGLEDILNLFDLPVNYDEFDLKRAKKIVFKLHPDKSGLDKNYFLFYSKAYKIVYSIYIFKNKNTKKIEEEEYNKDIDENTKIILDNTLKNQNSYNFNKKFNEVFEKCNVKENQEDDGYEKWLRDENDTNQNMDKNIPYSLMGYEIEKKKKEMKSIVSYKGIDVLYFNTQASYIDGETSNNSDLFSQLSYQDLKQAHTETLIPVCDEDYNKIKRFNSLNEYKMHRDIDKLNWNIKTVMDENKENIIEEETNRRAYKLAKQMEESKKKQELFLKEFRLLNDN